VRAADAKSSYRRGAERTVRAPAIPASFVPPLAPILWPAAFNHREWLFELKLDGFRTLAVVERSGCLLVSRTGYVYRAFAPLCAAIREAVPCRRAVLDGELVCLDASVDTQNRPMIDT
jgi:bifunctional non-homologous end joining protein LigD